MDELRDNDLFTQPKRSCFGECPICCLPLPNDPTKSTLNSCCSQSICLGCNFANQKRERDQGLENRCAFCREPVPKSKEECNENEMKRVKKKCPVALREVGKGHRDEGDYETAFEYFTNAAELGDADAHFELSIMYQNGQGVDKDMKKEVYHLEEAAIGGHPVARLNLGCIEADSDRFDRAKKHFIIAANLGYHRSLEALMTLYKHGLAGKEDYAGALRAYQAAVEATKSTEREEAEEAMRRGEMRFSF